jgi:hypothetical protein
MDFNFTQRAVEAGIDLNKCSDDVRASFMLNNIDDAAKLQSIETARAEIHKYLGPAVPVYRRDKEGRPTAVAIGIVQPTVDALGNFAAPSKQQPIQYLTNFTARGELSLSNWLELWFDAFCKVYLRRDLPVYEQIQGGSK